MLYENLFPLVEVENEGCGIKTYAKDDTYDGDLFSVSLKELEESFEVQPAYVRHISQLRGVEHRRVSILVRDDGQAFVNLNPEYGYNGDTLTHNAFRPYLDC